MNEGLEVDPNPSSFLPFFFVLHNFTNLSSTTIIYHLSLSKLPPTSDNKEQTKDILRLSFPFNYWLLLVINKPIVLQQSIMA